MNTQKIPIFIASDNNYAPFVAVAIASICYNTNNDIDFYILDGGINSFNKKQIYELQNKFKNCFIEYINIDINKYFKNFKTNEAWTVSTYFRFLIPTLKINIDKAIYLDCDVIVLDDINKLFKENLDNKIIGAVPEYSYSHLIEDSKNKLSISKNHNYFNAGVLLIDLKKWRNNNITDKLFTIEKKYREKLNFLDQDILNKCFDNDYKILNIKYNLLYSNLKEYNNYKDNIINEIENSKINTVIRHFTFTKPWRDMYYEQIDKTTIRTYILNFKEFWFFAKMTTFYNGLLNEFLYYNINKINTSFKTNEIKNYKLKFLNISFLRIKCFYNTIIIYLFNCIPIFKIITTTHKYEK